MFSTKRVRAVGGLFRPIRTTQLKRSIIQVKEHRQQIVVPAITDTPGDFEGAQFKFSDLLKDAIKKGV